MNLELDLYYANRFAMFASTGWKDFIDDIETMRLATDSLSGVTADTLKFKQGELSIMQWLQQLEQITKDAHAGLSVSLPEGAPIAEDQGMGAQDDAD